MASYETASRASLWDGPLWKSQAKRGWSHHLGIRHTKRPWRNDNSGRGWSLDARGCRQSSCHPFCTSNQAKSCTLNQANPFDVTEKQRYEYHQMHSPLHLLSQHVEINPPASVKAPTAFPESCTRSVLAASLAGCCPSRWRSESPELSHGLRYQTAALGMQRPIAW